MPQNIIINTHSSGKFRVEQINHRDHLVTQMLAVELNSVMNGLGYPTEAVTEAHNQLDLLPAPASHPVVNGERVSASSQLAQNAFGIGAMVTNPTIVNDSGFADLAIDIAIAEKDDRGVEVMKRIRNGEKIGVSTGLNAQIINKQGEMKGRKYTGLVSNINYDHVAILLHETPGGEKTFTVNSEDENSVFICNVDQSAEQKPQAKAPKSTKKGSKRMEQENLVDAVIVNNNNNLTESDRETLMGLNENALVSMVCTNSKLSTVEAEPVTVDEAVSVVENGGMFAINSDQKAFLDECKKIQDGVRNGQIEAIVTNSKMTKEQLEKLDDMALQNMADSFGSSGQDFSVNGANVTNADQSTGEIELPEGT